MKKQGQQLFLFFVTSFIVSGSQAQIAGGKSVIKIEPTNVQATESIQRALQLRKFATAEIRQYNDLISTLTERAEDEQDPRLLKHFNKGLKALTDDLAHAKQAVARLKAADVNEKQVLIFASEDVRESINDLQETGTHLIDVVVQFDRGHDEPEQKSAPRTPAVSLTASR